MKIAIYTSFAVNYLAKARVLANSVKAANREIDVVAVVCDRFPRSIDPLAEPFDTIWTVEDYPAEARQAWIFRHNIMELSTAVKGWALTRLLSMGYDYVMYLDPDCWVLRDPTEIVAALPSSHSVGVVPHTTRPAVTDEEVRLIETSSLRHGIYNLGFIVVRNDANGRLLATWWADRLDLYCVDDFETGLFTDQRWFDLATGYFDFILKLPHRGLDVASWNVGQRVLERKQDGYTVDGDDLIFYHFSGVGPAGVHRWVRDKFASSDPLAAELEFQYERLIAEQQQKELEGIKPYYDLYTDGQPIPRGHRKAFRDNPDFAHQFPDPRDVSQTPSFRDTISTRVVTATGRASAQVDLDRTETLARKIFDPEFFAGATGMRGQPPDVLWKAYLAYGWRSNIRPNRYFDPAYYRLWVDETDQARFKSPLLHYAGVGIENRLSPSWIFDDQYYLSRYSDILEAVRTGSVQSAFEHFSLYGVDEGRWGCAFFNESDYLHLYPDVRIAVQNGILVSGEQHFARSGVHEGRLEEPNAR